MRNSIAALYGLIGLTAIVSFGVHFADHLSLLRMAVSVLAFLVMVQAIVLASALQRLHQAVGRGGSGSVASRAGQLPQ